MTRMPRVQCMTRIVAKTESPRDHTQWENRAESYFQMGKVVQPLFTMDSFAPGVAVVVFRIKSLSCFKYERSCHTSLDSEVAVQS
jgi:hypothetical protein